MIKRLIKKWLAIESSDVITSTDYGSKYTQRDNNSKYNDLFVALLEYLDLDYEYQEAIEERMIIKKANKK
jgi:hypothetical protein